MIRKLTFRNSAASVWSIETIPVFVFEPDAAKTFPSGLQSLCKLQRHECNCDIQILSVEAEMLEPSCSTVYQHPEAKLCRFVRPSKVRSQGRSTQKFQIKG
eukprot:1472483-Amphidinium_carterae.1